MQDLYNSMMTRYYVNNGKIKTAVIPIMIKNFEEIDYEKFKQQTFDYNTIEKQFFFIISI